MTTPPDPDPETPLPPPLDEATLAFLLAEYQELNEERRRSRSEGPNRLNFFLTLASSLLGGLVLLGELGTMSLIELEAVAIAALAFLLLIGWDLFQFSLTRDVGTDFTLRAIARLRRLFVEQAPPLRRYLSWQSHDDPTSYVTRDASSVRTTTQAMLSAFAALLVGLLVHLLTQRVALALLPALAALLGSYLWLARYAARRLQRAREIATRTARFPRPRRPNGG